MAVKRDNASSGFKKKSKIKRPKIHAKTKQSSNKKSKNYTKISVGQG